MGRKRSSPPHHPSDKMEAVTGVWGYTIGSVTICKPVAASRCRWIMTQNMLQRQPKRLSGLRNRIFFNGNISLFYPKIYEPFKIEGPCIKMAVS